MFAPAVADEDEVVETMEAVPLEAEVAEKGAVARATRRRSDLLNLRRQKRKLASLSQSPGERLTVPGH